MPDQPEPYHMLIKGLVDQLTVQNDLLQQLIGQLPPAEESDIDGGAVLITEPAPPPGPAPRKAAPRKQTPRR